MLIATNNIAEKRKESKTMERTATACGKLNRVDLEDEQAIPLGQFSSNLKRELSTLKMLSLRTSI